jgi:hypothetical protein
LRLASGLGRNQAVANGYPPNGNSYLVGNGVLAEHFSPTSPLGKNTTFANDDPAQCNPASLC